MTEQVEQPPEQADKAKPPKQTDKAKSAEDTEKAKRRADVASAFIGFLIGLAMQETVQPVRESVRTLGIAWASVGLFVIFFLTCMRFFIGSVLHLQKKTLLEKSGVVWFTDFLVIAYESTILIFMAGVSTVEASSRAKFGFFAQLRFLFIVDIAWVVYLYVLWFVNRRLREKTDWDFEVPWEWAVVNTTVIVCMALFSCLAGGLYGDAIIVCMVVVNSLAFIADIWLADRAGLF
jgi:hypothetical protein